MTTPDATQVENLARALCKADGFEPDMRAYQGVPISVAGGRGYVALGQPKLAWELYAGLAQQTLILQGDTDG